MTASEVDEILNDERDFELCDRVFCAAADLTGNKIDWDAEPEPLRTVSLIWATHGIVGNGGFSYLLEHGYGGDAGFKLAADAFKRLGAVDASKAFEMLFDCFPDRTIPENHDLRFECYLRCSERDRDAIDSRFYRFSDEEVEKSLAAFIRSNSAEIALQLQR
jgi:hypothetical protein